MNEVTKTTNNGEGLSNMPLHHADVVVVGAGLSGLSCASKLAQAGQDVLCVEKARGTGGRLSSKRISTAANGSLSFDLGASSFSVETEAFERFVASKPSLLQSLPSDQDLEPLQYVPSPRSSLLTRALTDGVRLECAQKVVRIEKVGNYWLCYVASDNNKEILFSRSETLILAAPPEQSYALMPDSHAYKASLADVSTQPQWVSVFLVSYQDLADSKLLKSSVLYAPNSPHLARVIIESEKPERTKLESGILIKVEASVSWTESKLTASSEAIADLLWSLLINELWPSELSSPHPPSYLFQYTHRWLYSLPQTSPLSDQLAVDQLSYLPSNNGLALCGDYLSIWNNVSGVEAAFISGQGLALHLLSQDDPKVA